MSMLRLQGMHAVELGMPHLPCYTGSLNSLSLSFIVVIVNSIIIFIGRDDANWVRFLGWKIVMDIHVPRNCCITWNTSVVWDPTRKKAFISGTSFRAFRTSIFPTFLWYDLRRGTPDLKSGCHSDNMRVSAFLGLCLLQHLPLCTVWDRKLRRSWVDPELGSRNFSVLTTPTRHLHGDFPAHVQKIGYPRWMQLFSQNRWHCKFI